MAERPRVSVVTGGALAASGRFVRADDQGWTNRPHRA